MFALHTHALLQALGGIKSTHGNLATCAWNCWLDMTGYEAAPKILMSVEVPSRIGVPLRVACADQLHVHERSAKTRNAEANIAQQQQ